MDASCWTKFHEFYEPQGLFTKKQINVSERKIKFGCPVYTSPLYQKKYTALGIVVNSNDQRKKKMGVINPKVHMGNEK